LFRDKKRERERVVTFNDETFNDGGSDSANEGEKGKPGWKGFTDA